MFVELKGAGNHNKGAEMMLVTCLENLGDKNTKFVYAPKFVQGQYEFYSSLGLYPKASIIYRGMRLDGLARVLPAKLRLAFGLVADFEIEAVIDISGFAYSDQWGTKPLRRMAKDVRKWKKAGKKIILMPQAFGPFQNPENIKNIRTIINLSDIIFARDEVSYQSLCAICNDPKIRIAPDFTILLEGVVPEYFDPSKHQVCIVPNQRMMDKVGLDFDYIRLVVEAIEYFLTWELQPYFLVTGGQEDLQLSELINRRLSENVPIVCEEDPVAIKGLIKSSRGMFGSRFHSLASALYAGIPAVGLGWSHKYEHLYDDLGFSEGILQRPFSANCLKEKLSFITNDEKNKSVSKELNRHMVDYRNSVENMFADVNRILLNE